MTWAYSGDPSTTPTDQVRFLIGDTDDADHQLENEEIAWLLTQQSDAYRAAALACQTLVSKYARLVTRSVGTLSITYSDKYKHYTELYAALQLQAEAQTSVPVPISTGASDADKAARLDDPDWNGPEFSRGQFDDRNLYGSSGSVTSSP